MHWAGRSSRHRSPCRARSAMARSLRPLLVVAVLLMTGACSAEGPVDAAAAEEPTSSRSSASPPPEPVSVEISAVGDVIMGSTPDLPPDDGGHLFDAVADRLTGDVVLANLDQALTDIATSTKCDGDG